MSNRPSTDEPLATLERDGLIQPIDGRYRTTRRWKGAMMRAALVLFRRGGDDSDLRIPVAVAILELYPECDDENVLALLVETMATIEARELAPLAGPRPG